MTAPSTCGASRTARRPPSTPRVPPTSPSRAPRTTTGVAGSGALSSTGGSNPKAYAAFAEPKPSAVTLEAWVKTTSTRGGRIIGLGSSSANSSSSYDLALYLGDNGRVNLGVKNAANALVTTTSTQAVNDGTWHHVAAVVDAGGSSIVIDGKRAGRSQTATGGPDFRGYWRVLGDSTSGLGNRPTDLALSGAVDEVAVYTSALSDREAAHPLHRRDRGRPDAGGPRPTPTVRGSRPTVPTPTGASARPAARRLGTPRRRPTTPRTPASPPTTAPAPSAGTRHRRDAQRHQRLRRRPSRRGALPPRTAPRRGSRRRPPVVAASSGSAARRTAR